MPDIAKGVKLPCGNCDRRIITIPEFAANQEIFPNGYLCDSCREWDEDIQQYRPKQEGD